MRMSEHKFLWLPLLALLVFAMILSACGGPVTVQATATHVPTQNWTLGPTKASNETTVTETQTKAEGSGIDCMGAKSGDSLSLLYQWSGMQEDNLKEILKPLVDECGIVLKLESTGSQDILDALVKAGTPPDIAFGKVAQLAEYKTLLKPMTGLGVHAENYADYWKAVGTQNGNWLGLPVKVDLETIIWYSPANFQKFGYQVPATLSAFHSLIYKMKTAGNVPWSMGFEEGDSTGKIGAKVVEDIMLAEDGADYIGHIIGGTIPYNSAPVANAYRVYGSWAADDLYTPGGAQGTFATNINDAIYKVFSDPPEAMMVRQSGHVGEVIASQYPNMKFGTDYDFYQEPEAQGELHGGSDWMMAFNSSASVKALVAYLSSDQGGQMWAQVGFGNTPNSAGTNAYKDIALKKLAQILANSKAFVPDIEEALPEEFASAERQAIVDFINGADLNTELDNVAAVQKQVLGK